MGFKMPNEPLAPGVGQRLKFLASIHKHNEMLRFNRVDKIPFEPPGVAG